MYVKSLLASAILWVNLCAAAIDGSHMNTITEPPKNMSERAGRSLHKDCNGSLSAKCLKTRVLSIIEDLSSRDELTLLPGLSIVKENRTINQQAQRQSPDKLAAELSRQFSGRPEEKLNRFLMHRLQDYLDGHSLKYRLLDPKTSDEALTMLSSDSAFTGRKRNKGGGRNGLIAAALMMKGALAAAALVGLALLAGKALMAALMSLLLSAIVGLKGHGGGGKTTYEIIAKPEISHHHSHSQEELHEHEHGHHGSRRAYKPGPYSSYMPYETSNTSS